MTQKRSKPIIVVDDEKMIAMRHELILGKYFSNVLRAADGLQAWEIFKPIHQDIPVVITDIEMPNKDGIWLINQIRKINLSTQIIIVSTLTKNSVAIFSTYTNIAYLPKPVDEMHLRLAAFKAYDIFPEAVWIQALRNEIQGDKPNKERTWNIIQNNPWHQHEEAEEHKAAATTPPAATPVAKGPSLSIKAGEEIETAVESMGEDGYLAFKEEIEEILANSEDSLLALESDPANPELIAGLFRDFHTIKGNCGMLGLSSIKDLTHRIEDIFSAIRSGELQATVEAIDTSLKAKDIISRVLSGSYGDDLDSLREDVFNNANRIIAKIGKS